MRVDVKICGITSNDALNSAVHGGARYIGLVFHAASKRALSLDAAATLRRQIPREVEAVALVVDADDRTLQSINHAVAPDLFQLHGSETLKRVAEVRALTGKSIIKAMPIARSEDVVAALAYEEIADFLMFDAKAPAGAPAPGGTGQNFDWKLLAGRRFRRPWLLAGGLNPHNLKAAVDTSGARIVDVSSGVESSPGVKDPALIRAFLDTAKTL